MQIGDSYSKAPEIFSLVYSSSARKGETKKMFRDIADTSQAYNQEHGITGLLLVYGGLIMQFLEGPEPAVRALYGRIERDERHKNPMVMLTRTLEDREFPGWSMGFEALVDANDPDHLFRLTARTLRIKTPTILTEPSRTLIRNFARSSALA